MKTDFVINENEETVTIQAINGVVQELTFPRADYERLKEAINQPKVIATDDFQDFWQMYPKKKAKSDAQKAWKKLKPSKDLVNKIFISLEKFTKSGEWKRNNGQYIPYPASWLNGKRWEDEIIEERTNEKYDPAAAALERIKARRDAGRNQPNVSEHFWNKVYENDRLERKGIGLAEFVERRAERNEETGDIHGTFSNDSKV